ncbi:hypothetical protein ABZ070_37185, partial [Streptomyces sp. NPDC006283]
GWFCTRWSRAVRHLVNGKWQGGWTPVKKAPQPAFSSVSQSDPAQQNQQAASRSSSNFTWTGDHYEYTGPKDPHWTWTGKGGGGGWTYNPNLAGTQQQGGQQGQAQHDSVQPSGQGQLGGASDPSGGQQAQGQAQQAAAVTPAHGSGQAARSPVGRTGQDPAGISTTGSGAADAAATVGGQQTAGASTSQSQEWHGQQGGWQGDWHLVNGKWQGGWTPVHKTPQPTFSSASQSDPAQQNQQAALGSSSNFAWTGAADSGPAQPPVSDVQTATPTATHEQSPTGNDTAGNDTPTGSTESPGKWEATLNRGAKAINDIVHGNPSGHGINSPTGQINGNHGQIQDYSHSAGQNQNQNTPATSNDVTGTTLSNPSGNLPADVFDAGAGNPTGSGDITSDSTGSTGETGGGGSWGSNDYSSGNGIGDSGGGGVW